MHKCYDLWNILDQSKTIPDITKFLVIYEKLQSFAVIIKYVLV